MKRIVRATKIERVKCGLTQMDLFFKTGIPQWRISLIERGLPPTLDEAQKIADALNVTMEYLFPE